MKSQTLFENYSKKTAWEKNILGFRKTLGSDSQDVIESGLVTNELIGSLATMSTFKAVSLLPAHNSAAMHLSRALTEHGIDPKHITKRKTSLLSFLLNVLGFKKFDEVMDQVIHDGDFLDFKTAISAPEGKFSGVVFSVLKMLFPEISLIEGLISKIGGR